MKQYIPFGFLIFLFSCNLDTNKDLQIDQSYEGEEAYWVSKTLDEHFYLAFYDAISFADPVFTDSLPGCPTVTIENDLLTVTLDYDSPKCEPESKDRKGKLQLNYSNSTNSANYSIKIIYDGYQVKNSKIEGFRFFEVVQKQSSNMVLEETSDTLLLKDEHGSSTRLSLDLEHQGRIQEQKIMEISTNGMMQGRNWSGNQLEVLISTDKIMKIECIGLSNYRPVSGEESWTFQRSGATAVTHKLTYSNGEGCDTKTTINLAEGVTMIKQP